MPMTQRLAEILAEMVMASLDAKERRADRVERCPGCPYGSETIGSSGNPASPIVIVGEAPGRTEVKEGLPFVGPAGKTLRKAIEEAGLNDFDPFVTNSIACLPSPVTPRVGAIDACRGRLMRELESHPRTVVVAVGGTALRALTEKPGLRILEARCEPPIRAHGWLVVPTLHPSWVRRDLDGREKLLVSDLQRARDLAHASHSRIEPPPGAPNGVRTEAAHPRKASSESRPWVRTSVGESESKLTTASLESGPPNPKISTATNTGETRYRGRRSRAILGREPFIPDPVANLQVLLPGDTALSVSLAESEIRALNSFPRTEGLDAIGTCWRGTSGRVHSP
jgi:uracil-DNA glycosylase family 4